MFIYLWEKFPPTRLLGTTALFIFKANFQLSTYTVIHFQLKLACKKRGFDFWDKEKMKTMDVILLSYW